MIFVNIAIKNRGSQKLLLLFMLPIESDEMENYMKKSTLNEIDLLVKRYPQLETIKSTMEAAVNCIIESYKNGGKMLVCGNGGSAADSLHIVGELMKSFVLKRRLSKDKQNEIRMMFPENADYYISNLQCALPAISLVNETSLITAYANDNASDLSFAQQVLGYGRKGDILFAISTSGNSANVVHAARIAKINGLKVIGLTGESGGALKELCDVLLAAPSQVTYQIQEFHLPMYHAICLALENEFFEE